MNYPIEIGAVYYIEKPPTDIDGSMGRVLSLYERDGEEGGRLSLYNVLVLDGKCAGEEVELYAFRLKELDTEE